MGGATSNKMVTGDWPYNNPPSTAPNTDPYQVPTTSPWEQPSSTPMPNAGGVVYPMPNIQPELEPPIPGTEEFHDFMCWLAGFTDPENPPTQERWEAFQKKVQEMAALFFEYKKEQRAREDESNRPFSITLNTTGAGSQGMAGDRAPPNFEEYYSL